MTVCIAAIFNDGGIVAASDKMLTLGDATYEPSISKKVVKVLPPLIAMTAGHVALQAEIMVSMGATIAAMDEVARQNLTVKDAVGVYEACYNKSRLERITNEVLAPFGLDQQSFIDKQSQMSADFLNTLSEKMLNFR